MEGCDVWIFTRLGLGLEWLHQLYLMWCPGDGGNGAGIVAHQGRYINEKMANKQRRKQQAGRLVYVYVGMRTRVAHVAPVASSGHPGSLRACLSPLVVDIREA